MPVVKVTDLRSIKSPASEAVVSKYSVVGREIPWAKASLANSSTGDGRGINSGASTGACSGRASTGAWLGAAAGACLGASTGTCFRASLAVCP